MNSLHSRHRPIAQRELEAPALTFSAPQDLRHAAITSIFIRQGKGNRCYVGVTFNADKGNSLQKRFEKHHISTSKNVQAALQYDTKNASRQKELVKIAKHDRVIDDYQAQQLLNLINSR